MLLNTLTWCYSIHWPDVIQYTDLMLLNTLTWCYSIHRPDVTQYTDLMLLNTLTWCYSIHWPDVTQYFVTLSTQAPVLQDGRLIMLLNLWQVILRQWYMVVPLSGSWYYSIQWPDVTQYFVTLVTQAPVLQHGRVIMLLNQCQVILRQWYMVVPLSGTSMVG